MKAKLFTLLILSFISSCCIYDSTDESIIQSITIEDIKVKDRVKKDLTKTSYDDVWNNGKYDVTVTTKPRCKILLKNGFVFYTYRLDFKVGDTVIFTKKND